MEKKHPSAQLSINSLREHVNFVESTLLQEKAELTKAEKEVIEAIRNHELVTAEPFDDSKPTTFGDRISDHLAEIGGSWSFILAFGLILAVWVTLNSMTLFFKPFDPYPYIFLNLMLSCVAAFQAPVIMMSQNRQENKDRQRAEADYKTNLKAELEIRHLHIKLDQLITHQWQHLLEIQQLQLNAMKELTARKS